LGVKFSPLEGFASVDSPVIYLCMSHLRILLATFELESFAPTFTASNMLRVTPSSIFLHCLIKHRLFSLISWRFKLFVIVAAALFHVGLYQSRYLFPHTVDPGWNGVANRTAFLDRRCDRAIQKICRDKGALNCSGIQPSSKFSTF